MDLLPSYLQPCCCDKSDKVVNTKEIMYNNSIDLYKEPINHSTVCQLFFLNIWQKIRKNEGLLFKNIKSQTCSNSGITHL